MMFMLSDLWRTEEDRITKNTNKNSTNTNGTTRTGQVGVPSLDGHVDRKRAFSANDSSYSSEFSSPLLEHTRLTSEPRRIRCQARLLSMADDHNAENAYFEIHPDTPHGMIMSCSHPKCAASGRRFRYCRGKEIVCEVSLSGVRLCFGSAVCALVFAVCGACGHNPSL
jgi:hypothetical protein